MRLNRLDLIRYGRFQDSVLDFGAAPESGPDVMLVYGANEAGKSTAFTAWLDLLFGFRGAPQYAYRFDPKDKLVGAVLETPDGVQTLRRSAAGAGSLTDANGHVISEQRLASWLFGLDREAYANRFSLNDHILREGGLEIAVSLLLEVLAGFDTRHDTPPHQLASPKFGHSSEDQESSLLLVSPIPNSVA